MPDNRSIDHIAQFSSFLDLTDEQESKLRDCCSDIPKIDLLRPLIVHDLKTGLYSCDGVARSYGVSYGTVRGIGISIGIYKDDGRLSNLRSGVYQKEK